MPSRQDHLAFALQNEQLAPRVAAMGEYGWGITVLFYAALHLVQAYLVDSAGKPPRNHAARETRITRSVDLVAIHREYKYLKYLKWASERSRYDGKAFSESDFRSVEDGRYSRLASYMRRLVTA
jgi:hypothetical protein